MFCVAAARPQQTHFPHRISKAFFCLLVTGVGLLFEETHLFFVDCPQSSRRRLGFLCRGSLRRLLCRALTGTACQALRPAGAELSLSQGLLVGRCGLPVLPASRPLLRPLFPPTCLRSGAVRFHPPPAGVIPAILLSSPLSVFSGPTSCPRGSLGSRRGGNFPPLPFGCLPPVGVPGRAAGRREGSPRRAAAPAPLPVSGWCRGRAARSAAPGRGDGTGRGGGWSLGVCSPRRRRRQQLCGSRPRRAGGSGSGRSAGSLRFGRRGSGQADGRVSPAGAPPWGRARSLSGFPRAGFNFR